MDQLPVFPTFDYDTDKSNAGPRWKRWIDKLENLFVAINIDDENRKRALLLHYAGDKVYDIYHAEKGDTDETYDETVRILTAYFEPQTNIQMEIYKFRSAKQTDSQSLDEYVTELRQLAKNCEFIDVDREILSQVIQHCSSNRLRRRALREPNKTLSDILELGRTFEIADQQATAIERETVNAVKKRHQYTGNNDNSGATNKHRFSDKKHRFNDTKQKSGGYKQTSNEHKVDKLRQCIFCGGDYPHRGKCPAEGKTCNYCKKPNHFRSVCLKLKRKLSVNNVQQQGACADQQPEINYSSSDSDSDSYCYTINTSHTLRVNTVATKPLVLVKINNVQSRALVDTGASVNILDECTYHKIGKPKLIKGKSPPLYPYGSNTPLPLLGQCDVVVESKHKIQNHRFYVVKENNGTLIGYDTAAELGLVKLVNSVKSPASEFPELFAGIGKLKNTQVKLHIDKSVKPVAQKHRKIPFHLRDKVKNEIENVIRVGDNRTEDQVY